MLLFSILFEINFLFIAFIYFCNLLLGLSIILFNAIVFVCSLYLYVSIIVIVIVIVININIY